MHWPSRAIFVDSDPLSSASNIENDDATEQNAPLGDHYSLGTDWITVAIPDSRPNFLRNENPHSALMSLALLTDYSIQIITVERSKPRVFITSFHHVCCLGVWFKVHGCITQPLKAGPEVEKLAQLTKSPISLALFGLCSTVDGVNWRSVGNM